MTHLISTMAFVALCSALTVAVDKTAVRPSGAEPSVSWSHGLLVGDTLYVSAMGARMPQATFPGDFEAEVKQALNTLALFSKAAGKFAYNVVSVQVYLTNGATFERMNAVYKAYFKEPRPTRTTAVVAKLVGQGHVEITPTARKL